MIRLRTKTTNIITVLLIVVLMVTGNSSSALAVTSTDWKPGRIIDDTIFFNKNAMSVTQIQQFLNAKVPSCDRNHVSSNPGYQPPYTCLKEYQENTDTHESNYGRFDSSGNPVQITGGKSAAQIIWEVGQQYGLNPQVLIVMLQKEQSLVTDTWPWRIQYERAMGYACPDTAPCNEQYYGFYNQVSSAAWQMIRYIQEPDSFNFRAGVTRYIQYNPSLSCGGSNVFIETAATAALYNYTPYQPNPSAVTNLYGTAACGAYGNRNFWRMFNDWFGTTATSGFPLTRATSFQENGDPRQWLVYGTSKILIPDADIVAALNLEELPLINYPGAYLGSITSQSKVLTRIIRPEGSPDVFFADGGIKRKFSSTEMMGTWSIDIGDIVDVPYYIGLVLGDGGKMTNLARRSGSADVMLVDDGILRHITNPALMEVFQGSSPMITDLSQSYFSSMPQGSSISTPKVSSVGVSYIIDGRNALILDAQSAQRFPNWPDQTVSEVTINNYQIQKAPFFVRSSSMQEVYLIDNGEKNHITDPSILASWKLLIGNNSDIYIATQALTELLPNGQLVRDYLAENNARNYMLDINKYEIPTNLNAHYKLSTRSIFAASNALMSSIDRPTLLMTKFVKTSTSPSVYLVSNSGKYMHITSPRVLALWGGEGKVSTVSPQNLSRLTGDGQVGVYVSDGVNRFVLDIGVIRPVSSDAVASQWNLPAYRIFSDGTLAGMVQGDPLESKLKFDNFYGIVDTGNVYLTTDINIARVWNVHDAKNTSKLLVDEMLRVSMLGRAARSVIQGDNRQFIVNDGILYHLSPAWAANFHYNSAELTPVNPESISLGPIQPWNYSTLETGGVRYIIDKGSKRLLPEGVISDFWTSNSTHSFPVSSGFINLYPSGLDMERAIKGPAPEVYAAEAGTRRWIRSPDTYRQYYAPSTSVSQELIDILQKGPDI